MKSEFSIFNLFQNNKFKINYCLITTIIFLLPVLFQKSFSQNSLENLTQCSELEFEKFYVDNGLPSNSVMAIHQDRKGFIWLGTNDGLVRFDGYNFKTYSNIYGDSCSLSHNSIWSITEDSQGILWIGTEEGGLNSFNPATNKFTRYCNDPNDSTSIGLGYVMDIHEENENIIWLSLSKSGLNRFNKSTGKFSRFKPRIKNQFKIENNYFNAIGEDSNGNFWLASRTNGVNLFDRNLNKYVEIAIDQSTNSNPVPTRVTGIIQDLDGKLWVSTLGNGLYQMEYELKNGQATLHFYHQPILNDFNDASNIFRMIIDNSGNLWLATWGGGLIRFNPRSKSVKQYDSGYNSENISNIFVHSMFIDRSDVLWVGTDEGLNKADLNKKLFGRYEIDSKYAADRKVHRIHEGKDGTIWIGGGLLKGFIGGFKPCENQDIIEYIHDEKNINSLPDAVIESILEDSNRNLWIGFHQGGLSVLNRKTNNFTHFVHDPNDSTSISNNIVTALYEDKRGILWIGTLGGGLDRLDYWDENGQAKFSHFKFPVINSKDTDIWRIWYIFEDSKGFFWIGTRKGLVHYDQMKNKILDIYYYDPNDPNSLSDSNIYQIIEDQNGYLWIATSNGGLVKYIPEENKFSSYKIQEGLANNAVWNIVQDNDDCLWLATDKGFSCFNPRTEKFRNYFDSDGIGKGSYDAGLMSKSGIIYFGGESGLTIFDPKKLRNNPIAPQMQLTDFLLYNEPVNIDLDASPIKSNITYTDTINLSYSQNVFTFEFSALHYVCPAKNKYAYKLEGFDKDWLYVREKREATYTNLDPGEYTFKFKGSNSDRIWNEQGNSIALIISPPLWQTNWAYTIYFISFLSLLGGIRKYELNRRQEKEDRKLLELENKRKTDEFEKARELQLSMLPKELPVISNLDIAAFMSTATEVGGDYYDFFVCEDETLTVIIGDATGHGINAGMMVSISKGLFQSLAGLPDLQKVVQQFNKSLCFMGLLPMMMSLLILRIKGNDLHVINCGMPDLLLYCNKEKCINEIKSSGPPLGAYSDFNYQQTRTKLESKDVILSMSDGFTERFNENDEIFGQENCLQLIQDAAKSSSGEIIKLLNRKNDEWAGRKEQHDDITYVILKYV